MLERHQHRRDTPKAGGLGGQILELLRYRGLLEASIHTSSHNLDGAGFAGTSVALGLDQISGEQMALGAAPALQPH
ncbi:hypothetical protein ACWEPC_15985 [Nonomuraea sp. NPDC004297]